MEILFAHCVSYISGEGAIWLSVLLAGLLGGASHCSMMCAPLVAAQKIEGRGAGRRLLFYHAGRLTTYMALGVVAFSLAHLLFSGAMAPVSDAMLMLAGATFVMSAAFPKKTHGCSKSVIARSGEAATRQSHQAWQQIAAFASLTRNDKVISYFRGILLGFMPCGLVLSVLMLATTLAGPAQAAFALLLFGLATTPLLQLAGAGAGALYKLYPSSMAVIGRGVMACNGLILCGMGLHWVQI